MDETKVCKRCGKEKPLVSFPIMRKKKNGKVFRRGHCRSCSSYGTGNNIKREIKQKVKSEANYLCFHCGGFGDTIDHIVPVSMGGTNYYKNLICSCKECNSKRGNMAIKEFHELLIKSGVRTAKPNDARCKCVYCQ
ncbi:HNH endonuclease signature motif containing protein [Paenibacillus elgii]|uniref:HNH endonuclease n=1 Tax=Paenibacillus elgii TaxID=189691 RepID=UPI0009EE8DF2